MRTVVVGLAMMNALWCVVAVAQEKWLFVEIEAVRTTGLGLDRTRLVRVDDQQLSRAFVHASGGVASTVLVLNLFNDTVFKAIVSRTATTSSGYALFGDLVGVPFGTLTLVVNGDTVAGTVRTPTEIYDIRSTNLGVVRIRQVDPADAIFREPPIFDGGFQTGSRHPQSFGVTDAGEPLRSESDDDPSRIDVMVVYTPAARDAEGGTAGIRTLIDLFITETNRSYAESGIHHRLHLAHAAEVTYIEEPTMTNSLETMGPALRALTDPSDGQMDEVHAWRDQYYADLVHLVIGTPAGCSGLADHYGAFSLSSTPTAMYSNCPTRSENFAHEIGHNMGMRHDRYAEDREGEILRRLEPPHAFGYVNQKAFEAGATESRRWHTVMAYELQCADAGFESIPHPDGKGRSPCPGLFRFSNPDQSYHGDPMGVSGATPSDDIEGPADGRRAHNENASAIANFRRTPCLGIDGLAEVTLQAHNGQYLVAEGGGGGQLRADGNTAGPWERFTLEDQNGGCVMSGDVVHLRTDASFYVRAVAGGGDVLDAGATAPGTWESFRIHRVEEENVSDIRTGDAIAFQSHSGHYVLAVLGGGGGLNVGGTQLIQAWETFRVAISP